MSKFALCRECRCAILFCTPSERCLRPLSWPQRPCHSRFLVHGSWIEEIAIGIWIFDTSTFTRCGQCFRKGEVF